jgi:hypothetical protein
MLCAPLHYTGEGPYTLLSSFILKGVAGTLNSTSDYTLRTLYRSYFKTISDNIELQVYSVTCCLLYLRYDCGHTIDLVLIDPQSVGKRTHDLMDTVNAK